MSQDLFETNLKIRVDLKNKNAGRVGPDCDGPRSGGGWTGLNWFEWAGLAIGPKEFGLRGGGSSRAGLLLKRAGPLEDWAGPPEAVWATGLSCYLCWPGEEELAVSKITKQKRRREVVRGGRVARVAVRGKLEAGWGAEGVEVRESGRVS
ncbi:hypothetical protein CRG98_040547 [Punica granatum]|uniref:Uncharacterized protein n=1 Tax=Punica granatum TaxID=22663 RepID=A0A2I0I5V4_PUNGR|nr:hypothetical protein CRG98_040547 [Punica granatum]